MSEENERFNNMLVSSMPVTNYEMVALVPVIFMVLCGLSLALWCLLYFL